MSALTVKRAIEHLIAGPFTVSGYPQGDLRRLDEFTVPGNVQDARYRMHVLARTVDTPRRFTGIIRYRGVRYCVSTDAFGRVTVEPASRLA